MNQNSYLTCLRVVINARKQALPRIYTKVTENTLRFVTKKIEMEIKI